MTSKKKNTRRILALTLGLVIGAFGWRLLQKAPEMPELTLSKLNSAKALWQKAGINNYEMTILVVTDDSNQLKVVVSEGNVINMETSGTPVANSSQKYWTVSGMFDFLEVELSNAQKKIYGDANAYVDAKFHAELGYPLEFRRQVFGKPMNAHWQVTQFQQRSPLLDDATH